MGPDVYKQGPIFMKYSQSIILFFLPLLLFSQIKVIEQKPSNDVKLIGKISHTSAYQTSSLSRKLPVLDPLLVTKNEDINKYRYLREEANSVFKAVPLRKMTFIDEEFIASLLYFNSNEKYLLTIKNSEYNFQNESFWLSKQSKEDLYNLIRSELDKKPKFKNIEVVIDNNFVLVVTINRKKVSFSLWDGNYWIKSYWFRSFKFDNLFGNG